MTVCSQASKISPRSLARIGLGGISVVALVWSTPVAYNNGWLIASPFIIAGSFGLLVALRWAFCTTSVVRLWQRAAGRALIRVAISLCLVGLVLFGAVSRMMIRATFHKPSDHATLIVLGCQVRGDRPSHILHGRLVAALAYLREHPNAPAVLSGGQGRGEWITEAEAIRRYLVENGIAEDRLFLEDQSTSTYENIRNSKEIIEKHGLPTTIAIATDGFHQLRAQKYAKRAGLEPGAVCARTRRDLLPFYWVRETAAVVVQVLMSRTHQAL